ncbi:nucleoside hydrolase [Lysobacter concretionis Ko07 = DSM 16239]|uniref:Nucleoside hydrolase n=1 Tax=Lysobacter concretionis Ko07 = DSM 16239 TaxID=1122185 RepID=A0A0A0EN55_9GAMM|nr:MULTISPECIES: nucleoside hydrolase [Lysobacter]KGM51578.1 nucleoside hydrolase [Lysobacter concretionis Ko07 = DSM 16239]QOD90671.1 nucleoside hydrolase [Lysobacter sp. CW239]
MTEPRIPLLIDTDPGVDDALALLMAFNDERHEVVGLTIAAGNVGLAHTVGNALKLCDVAGVDVPVFAGCAGPLLHPALDAAYVHGQDGFGDIGYTPSTRRAETEHAALAILRLSHQYAGKLRLVALGPLTNLALALKLDPSLPSRIGRLVVMGGAVSAHGNMTPAAEFNIAFDPEAAHIVLTAFPQFELVDWEATVAHGLPHEQVVTWLEADSPRAQFFRDISRKTREWSVDRRGNDWFAADALAMAHALYPQGATELALRPLAVELEGRHTRGATVVDWQREHGGIDNATILMRYDQSRFEELIRLALAAG